jgi:hypothetical protein
MNISWGFFTYHQTLCRAKRWNWKRSNSWGREFTTEDMLLIHKNADAILFLVWSYCGQIFVYDFLLKPSEKWLNQTCWVSNSSSLFDFHNSLYCKWYKNWCWYCKLILNIHDSACAIQISASEHIHLLAYSAFAHRYRFVRMRFHSVRLDLGAFCSSLFQNVVLLLEKPFAQVITHV